MSKVYFRDTDLSMNDIISVLASLKFEELTEEGEFEYWVMTQQSREDVLNAVKEVFKDTNITVYFDQKAIFNTYICDDCGSRDNKKHDKLCMYLNDDGEYYDPEEI